MVTCRNMNTPNTEKMKYTSISNANTLNNDGNENVIVCNNAYNPLYLFNRRNNRDTLSTLSTLAS